VCVCVCVCVCVFVCVCVCVRVCECARARREGDLGFAARLLLLHALLELAEASLFRRILSLDTRPIL